MIDYQRIYHTGARVADVDAAMDELGSTLGLTWTRVQYVPDRSVWTPERGLEHVELTFVYSREGPQHLELLHGSPGSVWDGGDDAGVHHVGIWSDDVPRDVARCTAAGWRVTAAASSPDDGYGSFAYVAPPAGIVVELVSSAARPRFDAWFAGGSLGSDRD